MLNYTNAQLKNQERVLFRCFVVGDCWYPHTKLNNGYGVIKFQGSFHMLHRFSYEAFIGPLVPELQVHHKCGNKACSNPSHLEALSPKDHRKQHGMPKRGGERTYKDFELEKAVKILLEENNFLQQIHQKAFSLNETNFITLRMFFKLFNKFKLKEACWESSRQHKDLKYDNRKFYINDLEYVYGAHRAADWFFNKEPKPSGPYHVHHSCKNKACFNPSHLEALTCLDHGKEKADAYTTCINGHEVNEINTYQDKKTGYRRCRVCNKINKKKEWLKNPEKLRKRNNEGYHERKQRKRV